SMTIYAGIYLVYSVLDFKRHFTYEIDEFMHWGKMVRIMDHLDRFYCVPESNLLAHKDYPPLISVIELLFGKASGGVSEGSVSFGIHLLSGLLICASFCLFAGEKESRGGKIRILSGLLKGTAMGVSSMVLMRMFDSYDIFNTIYTDLYIAAAAIYLFAFILCLGEEEGKTETGAVILISSAILLSKQIGIFFAGLSFVLYFLVTKKKIRTVFCVLIPAFSFLTWKIYIKILGLSGQFELGRISIKTLFKELMSFESTRSIVTREFLKSLFDVQLSWGIVPLTFFGAFIVCIAALIFLYRYGKDGFGTYRINITSVMVLAGAIGYIGTLYVLYMFCFEEYEMRILASFNRYMSTYWLFAIGLIAIMLLSLRKEITLSAWFILLAVLVCVCGPMNLSCLKPQVLRGELMKEYREFAEQVIGMAEPGDRIFVITPNRFLDNMYLQYYLDDIDLIDGEYDYMAEISAGDPGWEAIENDIVQSSYVLVMDPTDAMKEEFADKTDGDLKDGCIYKVETDGRSFMLHPVANY
ncbi:MAG: hypothetical protein K5888_08590, partial [Lachnospiraceae bacterium]|nr:hypothetical protein [Lachnospiraceae bacterium]